MIAELAVGNVVRRVLHMIREEDLTLKTAGICDLNLSAAGSDDEDDPGHDDHPVLLAAAVAAAARNSLRPPSLHTLLEDVPHAAAVPNTSSSGGDSEGRSKCKHSQFFYLNNSTVKMCGEIEFSNHLPISVKIRINIM